MTTVWLAQQQGAMMAAALQVCVDLLGEMMLQHAS